jgi:hypothetical protein
MIPVRLKHNVLGKSPDKAYALRADLPRAENMGHTTTLGHVSLQDWCIGGVSVQSLPCRRPVARVKTYGS